jgi:hypothetical protein
MPQSATAPVTFPAVGPTPLEVDFLGGRLTSDGGLPWLAEADAAVGLTERLAAEIPDWRRRRGRHDLRTLVAQRIYQIACGYEDQNDATTLRTDPLLKHVCGRLPLTDPDLASQPTFSRLENAVSARTCYRLAQMLGEIYLRERERDGIPTHLVLDLDGTDDPTHGEQEGSAYHGYYGQYQYFPLLVFDGETDHLITAVLRPGTVHAGHGGLAILKRIVAAVRARWPDVTADLRCLPSTRTAKPSTSPTRSDWRRTRGSPGRSPRSWPRPNANPSPRPARRSVCLARRSTRPRAGPTRGGW